MTRREGDRRVGLLVAVALLVVAAIAVSVLADDDGPTSSTATPVTSTTSRTSTTSTTIPLSIAVWPPPGSPPVTDVRAAATNFATDYLGMADPLVGELLQGDARSGEVEVRPRADGPVTTLFVRLLGGDGGWSVLGAATADVELSSPSAFAEVTSPVRLSGRALAFEGTVEVEVREDGAGSPLGTGFVTGGGDVMRPFTGEVRFDREPAAPAGAIVLVTRSAEDGGVWSASVVRVHFAAGG